MQLECKNEISYLQHNKIMYGSIQVKDPALIAPSQIAVVVYISGRPAHTLIDLGCLSDSISEIGLNSGERSFRPINYSTRSLWTKI